MALIVHRRPDRRAQPITGAGADAYTEAYKKRSVAAEAWSDIFEFGFDMLHRGGVAGITLNDRLEPDLVEARAAWRCHGETFLTEYSGQDSPWAFKKFGKPGGSDAYTEAR